MLSVRRAFLGAKLRLSIRRALLAFPRRFYFVEFGLRTPIGIMTRAETAH
jgi:hypothetical protein